MNVVFVHRVVAKPFWKTMNLAAHAQRVARKDLV